jgi:hypothetical protein
MATNTWLSPALLLAASVALPFSALSDQSSIQREIDLIRQQNHALEQQIKTLTDKVTILESKQTTSDVRKDYSNDKTNSAVFPRLKLGVQGGLGFAHDSSGGAAFFVDDAKLSLAAQLPGNIDLFADVNLNTLNNFPQQYTLYSPSSFDRRISLNEIYLDFHHLLESFGFGPWVNVRAGQFYIPFGEEYAVRYPFDNPLIWRSASDIWGLSPGLEIYGGSGKWSYVLAIQNRASGGDGFDADKSVAGRIRFDANTHFSISASAMRTGRLTDDSTSALWFNGFPAFAGSGLGTNSSVLTYADTSFVDRAYLFELDPQFKWNDGHVKISAGAVLLHRIGSNQSNGYYSVEALQHLFPKLYLAGRVSQLFEYHLNHLRWSAGLGYRFNNNIILKADYTDDYFNERDYGAAVGGELAFRF